MRWLLARRLAFYDQAGKPYRVVGVIVRGKDMTLEAVRRAARLTERLLAFARQQPLEPKAIDANRLVGGIWELLRRMVGEPIALEAVVSGRLWVTQADVDQLENAILNLVLNARDAMPNGGKVTIETTNAHLDDAYVRKLAEPVKGGQYVMISVSDIGNRHGCKYAGTCIRTILHNQRRWQGHWFGP
jgi:signal transduction histidine kinase